MILLFTCAFAVLVTLASVFVPGRMQVIVPVTAGASLSEIALPVGYWLAVSAWMAGVVSMSGPPRRATALWCIAIAFALHALLLLMQFVPRLSDRDAFSAGVYLWYARAFCAGAVAVSTAWLLHWLQRLAADARLMTVLEAPLAAGWLVLSIAVVRYNVPLAAAGLVTGAAAPAIIRRLRAGTTGAHTLRALMADERVFLGAVFVVAVALRLLYVSRIMTDPNFLDAGADGRLYDELAWSVARGEGIRPEYANRFPLLLWGYVWFAGLVYAVAGHSYAALTTVQSLLGGAACLLIYGIGNRLFGRGTARVAAIFTAVSFPLLFAAATLGHQALDVFLTVLLAWVLLRLLHSRGSPWRWSIAGVILGVAFAVRETNVFLAAFLAPWIAFSHRGGWRKSWPALAAFAGGAAIVMIPFVAPKLWRPEDRAAMRAHFDRLYRGEGEVRATPRTGVVGPLTNPDAALAQLRAEPARVIATLARAYATNFAVQFLTQPYGGFDLVFLRKGSPYYYGMWFYAYTLTVIGAVAAMRRIRAGGSVAAGMALVLGLIAARTVPHLILESDYRHRVPIEPFLILLASAGAAAIWREVKAAAASTRTSGFTGNDWRVSESSGR